MTEGIYCVVVENMPVRGTAPVVLIFGGVQWCQDAWDRHTARNAARCLADAAMRRHTGLAHIVHGHLNKHLLRMKYINRVTDEQARKELKSRLVMSEYHAFRKRISQDV